MKRIALALLVLIPANAQAATYYVAKTGDDNNSCATAGSQSSPRQPINRGLACLGAGDTLIVRPGTYEEVLPDVIPSGLSGAPTVVRAEPRRGAVIMPSAAQQSQLYGGTGVIVVRGRSHIRFEGFVVDG